MTRRPIVRATKYGAVPTEIDGVRFASKAEARRYGELVLLQRAGAIRGLLPHPKWELIVNGQKIGGYTADFLYCDPDRGLVVEDVKGRPSRTEAYKLRRKLMQALHGIEITEVEA